MITGTHLETRKLSQKKRILKWFQSGYSLTGLEALNKFGCFRLPDVAYKLKEDGYDIKKRMITQNGKRFACYYIPMKNLS